MITYGKRINYERIDDNKRQSRKVYTNGQTMVRVILDESNISFKLVDPVSGLVYHEGGRGVNNLEVLQRHIKKALVQLLDIRFDKEERNNEP